MSGCSQNVETSCKNKLKLTKLKNLFFKKKMIVYNSNSKTLKFQWKRYCFSLWAFSLILNAFTVGTGEYYQKCYKVNDAKDLKILYQDWNIILRLQVPIHKYWLIHLGLFRIRTCLKGSQIIHTCYVLPIRKEPNSTSQFKVKITKGTSADMED